MTVLRVTGRRLHQLVLRQQSGHRRRSSMMRWLSDHPLKASVVPNRRRFCSGIDGNDAEATDSRCALVTGAASGIGLACARLLAERGWRVALADTTEADGRAAAAEICELHPGSNASFYLLDVRDEAQTEATVSKVVADFGRLDGAIANAGVVFQKSFLETTTEEFTRVLDVNLLGTFLTGRTVARVMAAQGTGGAIVNMSSVNASLVIPGMSGYVASKGGVQQLTRLMAIELAPHAIRVNAIAPGSVGTEMAFATCVVQSEVLDLLTLFSLGRAGSVLLVTRWWRQPTYYDCVTITAA